MLLQHPLSISMSSQHPNLKESPPGQHLPPHLQQEHHQQHDDDELYQKLPFPYKLHQLLEDVVQEGKEHIISWLPSGTAFKVHRPLLFTSEIMSNYFRQTQYKSFTRQLYIYGFHRVQDGYNQGAYYHPNFVRGDKMLSLSMTTCRRKKKGKKTGPIFLPHQTQPQQEVAQSHPLKLHDITPPASHSSSADSRAEGKASKPVTGEGKSIMQPNDDGRMRRGSKLSEPMMRTFIERNERIMEGNVNSRDYLLMRDSFAIHQYPGFHPHDDRITALPSSSPISDDRLQRPLPEPPGVQLETPSNYSFHSKEGTNSVTAAPTFADHRTPSRQLHAYPLDHPAGSDGCRCLHRLLDRLFQDSIKANVDGGDYRPTGPT